MNALDIKILKLLQYNDVEWYFSSWRGSFYDRRIALKSLYVRWKKEFSGHSILKQHDLNKKIK